MRHRSHRNSTALSKYVWSLKDKTLILTSDGLFGGEPQPTRILQGCATCALRRSLRSSRQIRSGLSTREQSSSQNVDTRTASTSVISRRLCHEPVPLYFSDFLTLCFLPIFQIADFSILSNFSNYFRPFSDLAVVFRIFSRFFLYIITRSSSFFDDSLGFIIFYGFLWLFVFPLKSQLHACPLSSPMFFHPLLTR